MRRSGRVGIVVVMIVSIVMTAITSKWARSLRADPNQLAAGASSNSSLANMNSFALALLLGGLRGPLVMFLWTNSENQKNEKNLEDFDTYVEWIRLLQPEFDSVHIFQVWNKTYNISVQMADQANKYTTILDGIDYARRVENQRPNNINMVYQIGSIFFDKLGNAQEKNYYKKRVREESLPHATRQKLSRSDPGWRRLDLDPSLDAKGMILPELLKPRYTRPADLPKDSEWNDGSELQYLAPYQPLPYGLDPAGFAYNYHKQAQVLQDVGKQTHANLSDLVVDSRPATALEGWSKDEWERGRRLEAKAFNAQLPEERREMELTAANVAPDTPFSDREIVEEAIYSYNLASRLAHDSITEYERHLRGFANNLQEYQTHIDDLKAEDALVEGDRDYLKAMLATGTDRHALLELAKQHYRQSIKLNTQIIFSHYISDDVAKQVLPPGITRSDLSKLPDDQYPIVYDKAMALIKGTQFDPDVEDRSDYQRYIERAQARLKRIGN